jgi:hypothetical protein
MRNFKTRLRRPLNRKLRADLVSFSHRDGRGSGHIQASVRCLYPSALWKRPTLFRNMMIPWRIALEWLK